MALINVRRYSKVQRCCQCHEKSRGTNEGKICHSVYIVACQCRDLSWRYTEGCKPTLKTFSESKSPDIVKSQRKWLYPKLQGPDVQGKFVFRQRNSSNTQGVKAHFTAQKGIQAVCQGYLHTLKLPHVGVTPYTQENGLGRQLCLHLIGCQCFSC